MTIVRLARIVRKEQTSNILRIVRKGQSTKQAQSRQQTPSAVINYFPYIKRVYGMNESILEQWPVERLVAYEKNPRQNDHAVDQIAEAIHAFGFRVPVVAKSCGMIVDGHLRLKAAKKLGLKTVPVLLADDMTENEVKAFRISVNKMAELADWDFDILRAELLELDAAGLDCC